jgi:ABC-type branched-subunit amino acid transport system permease subunit
MRIAAAVGLAAALAIPVFGTRDLVTATFFTFLYLVLALNYDILGGFLGYMNLGQGAFFGLAAT